MWDNAEKCGAAREAANNMAPARGMHTPAHPHPPHTQQNVLKHSLKSNITYIASRSSRAENFWVRIWLLSRLHPETWILPTDSYIRSLERQQRTESARSEEEEEDANGEAWTGMLIPVRSGSIPAAWLSCRRKVIHLTLTLHTLDGVELQITALSILKCNMFTHTHTHARTLNVRHTVLTQQWLWQFHFSSDLCLQSLHSGTSISDTISHSTIPFVLQFV